MLFILRHDGFLRIAKGRGSRLRVLAGRIWLTEEGCEGDRLLGPGGHYRVGGDGLVLISLEHGAHCGDEARLALEVDRGRVPWALRISQALQAVKQLQGFARR